MTRKFIVTLLALIMVASAGLRSYPVPQAQAFLPGFDTLNAGIQGIGHGIQGAFNGSALPLHGGTAAATGTSAGAEVSQIVIQGNTFTTMGFDSALNSAFQVCDAPNKTSFLMDLTDTLGNSFANMGDQTKTTGTFFVAKKLISVKAQSTCLVQLNTYINAPGITTSDNAAWQALLSGRQKVMSRMNAVEQLKSDYEAQQKAQFQDVFLAFGAAVAINLNEGMTRKVVKGVKDSLNINDIWGYTQALTNQVYAWDYLEKNYAGDAEKQLIMTSLLKSRSFPGPKEANPYYKRAQVLAQRRAEKERKQKVELMRWSNNEWYNSVSNMAGPAQFASEQMRAAEQELETALLAAKQTADMEVNASYLKGTRDCSDRSADQKQIDLLTDRAVTEQRVAAETLKKLQDLEEADFLKLLANPGRPRDYPDSEKQIAKAQAVLDQANANLDGVPKQVKGGVVKACGLLESPGKWVEEQLSNLIDQQLKQASTLNEKNMPLYARIAAKFTSRYVTETLFGKSGSKSLGSTLEKAVNQSVYEDAEREANQGEAVDPSESVPKVQAFTYQLSGGQLTLNINIPAGVQVARWQLLIDYQLKAEGQTRQLSNYRDTLDSTRSHRIQLSIFDSQGRNIANDIKSYEPKASFNSNSGQVAGSTTNVLQPRGASW